MWKYGKNIMNTDCQVLLPVILYKNKIMKRIFMHAILPVIHSCILSIDLIKKYIFLSWREGRSRIQYISRTTKEGKKRNEK